jgi:hypothetical protein
LIISLIVAFVLVGTAALFLGYYLRSSHVTSNVTTRLQDLYGGTVRIGSADVGLGSSTLNGLELFEEGSNKSGSTPWFKVDLLDADVSLWELLLGRGLPKHLSLNNATVLLRFDREGRLITRFPPRPVAPTATVDFGAIPTLDFKQTGIIFRKEGHPDLVARNVSLRLTRGESGNLAIAGNGDSIELGKLVMSGSLDPQSRLAVVRLKTETKVHVTRTLLDTLPFVPASTWQEVLIAPGDTPAELNVRYDLRAQSAHFRLEMAPENTTVSVPALGLTAHNAHGKLVVEDGLVQLRDLHGKAYGGDIEIEGDLDFRGEASKLTFSRVKVTDLDVRDLPTNWGIPDFARTSVPKGRFCGNAKLEVAIRPGKPTPIVVNSLVGLAAGSGSLLTAALAVSAFPGNEVQSRSVGKGAVTGSDGSSAEFDWKLPFRANARPPTPTTSQEPAVGVPPSGGLEPAKAGTPTAAMDASILALPQSPADERDFPQINVILGRGVAKLFDSVERLLYGIARVGGDLIGAFPKSFEVAPAKPGAPPSYVNVNLKLKNVELGPFVKRLGIKLDYPIEGKLSFQVKGSVPRDDLADLKRYKANGTAQVTQLQVAGIRIETVDVELVYADGVLKLSELKGRFAAAENGLDPTAGIFRGSGTLQVVPLGELTANLILDRIPLNAVVGAPGDDVPVGMPALAGHILAKAMTPTLGGTFSGHLKAWAPAYKLKSPEAIEATGQLSGERLSALGFTVVKASSSLQLKGGVLLLPDLQANLEGTPVTASAELKLAGDYPFNAHLDLKDWDLSALKKLAGRANGSPILVAGLFTTSVDVNGALSPFKVAASGNAATARLKFNGFQIATGKLHWEADGQEINLTAMELGLYGGEAAGSAVLPLTAATAGSVNLKLTRLDAGELLKDLAVPFNVEGKVDGQLKGTLPPTADTKARTVNLDIDVTAAKLRLENIPAEQVHGKLDYKDGVVDYKLDGKTLGGTVELEGQIPSADPLRKESKKGRLRIHDVVIGRLARVLNMHDAVPLTGRLSVELDFTHDTPDRQPKGSGRLRVANLRLKGTGLATDLEGELLLSEGLLRLRELGGEIAQGTFHASLSYNLLEPTRRRFSLALDNVEVSQLLGPWLGEHIKGPVTVSIRGALGASWRGTADVKLARGAVLGVEVIEWQLPVRWHYAPGTGRAQIEVYDTGAMVARGRVMGKVSLSCDASARVEGNLRFSGVELQTLLRQLIGPTLLGGGQMTGRFDFSGSDVHSINDLSGNLIASFSQAQALQLPILRQIAPHVGVGPSTTFQHGDLRARFDHGVFRIQQLALEGGKLQLLVEGTVSQEGRLSLNIAAKIGEPGAPTGLRALALRIPIVGPIPQIILKEASGVLASRVINLDVTGTVHNPVLRLRPLPLMTDEAVRFFLGRSNLPIPLAQ